MQRATDALGETFHKRQGGIALTDEAKLLKYLPHYVRTLHKTCLLWRVCRGASQLPAGNVGGRTPARGARRQRSQVTAGQSRGRAWDEKVSAILGECAQDGRTILSQCALNPGDVCAQTP